METLNTHSEQPVDTSEHDAAMIAKAEASQNAGADDRPEWLPEKFKSPEDMAKAYSQLEKKMSSPEDAQENDQDYSPEATADDVVKTLDNVGLDFNSFQDEYSNNGGLTESSYKSLEEKGFSRDLVNSWIAGQEALASTSANTVYEQVGGQDQYFEMVDWATTNMSEGEVNSYNRAMDSGDINLINLAVEGLQSKYRSAVGNEPTLVKGDNAPTASGAFQSAAELTAAMRDPRYNADPAYRKSVADKLARSNVF